MAATNIPGKWVLTSEVGVIGLLFFRALYRDTRSDPSRHAIHYDWVERIADAAQYSTLHDALLARNILQPGIVPTITVQRIIEHGGYSLERLDEEV